MTGDNDARWAEGLARIESAEVKVDGNAATVLYRSARAVAAVDRLPRRRSPPPPPPQTRAPR